MFLLAILVLLLTLALWSHRAQKYRRDAVSNLGGPICLPIVGALHFIFKVNPKNFLTVSRENTRRMGMVQRVWAFNRLLILSADMELNEKILSSQEHLVKHPVYKLLGKWLGNGLLLSDGKTWHQRRKIITPTFHFKILEQFVDVFDQQSSVCVARLAERADGITAFDINPYICLAALDIIAETAMGTKVHAQTSSSSEYANAVNECTALMAWRFMSVYRPIEFLFTLTHPFVKWRQTQLIRTMHDFTIKVIEQRRSTLTGGTQKQNDLNWQNEDVGEKRRMALLDVLLQSTIDGQPLTNEQIREEVDTFMFEGHDTTASAICFALCLLSRHAKVQEQLLAEVLRVLGTDKRRPITLGDLTELKYMECVIKESLRMYPSVPVVGRKLQTDFKYTHSTLGTGMLPAGSEIILGLIGVHHDSRVHTKPEVFDPDRHQSGERSNGFALVPFSAGPRNCIGQKFAVMEMKVILAKIVREFELLPLGKEVKPVVNIVLRSDTGFQLGLRRRTEQQSL